MAFEFEVLAYFFMFTVYYGCTLSCLEEKLTNGNNEMTKRLQVAKYVVLS